MKDYEGRTKVQKFMRSGMSSAWSHDTYHYQFHRRAPHWWGRDWRIDAEPRGRWKKAVWWAVGAAAYFSLMALAFVA